MKTTNINTILSAIFLFGNISWIYSDSLNQFPQADYRDKYSSVSIRGNISGISDSIIFIKTDCRNISKVIKTRIIGQSDLFTEFGGAVDLSDLAINQYVWIWFRSTNSGMNKKIEETGALILWSKDPKDQPRTKDKSKYDKPKLHD